MKLLARRGMGLKAKHPRKSFWRNWHSLLFKKTKDLGSLTSLQRALENNVGVEIDLRDYRTHPTIDGKTTPLRDFLKMYDKQGKHLPVALNIKTCGLVPTLKELLKSHALENYFCHNMSVPEMVVYAAAGLKFFTRQSEIERECVMYEDAAGVLLDAFFDDWFGADVVLKHLDAGKNVAIVSPEIHGRSPEKTWNLLKDNKLYLQDNVYLITENIDDARTFFGSVCAG